MECHSELDKSQQNLDVSAGINGQSSCQASQRTKLGDRFKLDEFEHSYTDLHSQVAQNVDIGPQKQSQRKGDELVRYMSNLPSYLEKGEKHQDKALNVGVLDWCHLERWQNNHQQIPHQSYRSSSKSSNTSSFFSMERTSSYLSKGRSCSPIRQRMQPTALESNLHASPCKVHSTGIKSSEKNGLRYHDGVDIPSNYLKVQQSILKTHQSYNKYTENKLLTSKAKLKSQNCGYFAATEKLLDPHCNHADAHGMDGKQTAVFQLGKDGCELKPPESCKQSDSTGAHVWGPVVASEQSFSLKSDFKGNMLSSDRSQSCFLSSRAVAIKPQIEHPSSTETKSIRPSSEMSQVSTNSTNISVSPARGKKLESKKSCEVLQNSNQGLKPKTEAVGNVRIRNPSPTRRVSFSMGRMGRSSSSEDMSSMPHGNGHTSKLVSGEAGNHASLDDSSCDKSNANAKARSSPLRRLLGPLFKPKPRSSGSSQRASAQVEIDSKMFNERGEAPALHSAKVKLDLGSCKTINIDHPHDLGKCKSTMAQALLQVAVKNGLPLFTFAVENSSDILAATMRKQSTGRKDGSSWIYTFFTIHEMKKKYGNWLNHGRKDKIHGLMPNIVGQMKMSDVLISNLIRQNCGDQCSIREFVLSAMNMRQADEQASELPINSELAAILLEQKKTKMTSTNSNGCDLRKSSILDPKEQSEECGRSECGDVEERMSSSGSQNHFELTAILPGGDHGLPSKGKPTSLIEKWRLGGSCDCGGWDLGCRLRVASSQAQFNRKSNTGKTESTTRKIQLYPQEPVSDRKAIFSLSLFKDGIYSVEFDSSLKLLQAFSICIAVLNGLRPAELSEISNVLETKPAEEISVLQTDGAKVSKRDQGRNPSSYISCPPSSPVARV